MALLAGVPGAGAQETLPPDSSEFDQYVPQVPEAEEDTPVRDKKQQGGGDDSESGALPSDVAEDLAAEGEAGEAAAAAAEATGSGGKKDGNGGGVADRNGKSPASAVAGTVASDSDDGVGIVLPLILVATLVGGVAYLVVRRRRAGGDGAAGSDGG